MSIHTPARRPAGAPASTGGQFAPSQKGESDLDLAVPEATTSLVRIDPGVVAPDGTQDRLAVIVRGIEARAAVGDTQWRVTDITGNADHTIVYVAEVRSPGLFRIETDDRIVSVTVDDGSAHSYAMLLGAKREGAVERIVSENLATVVATHRAHSALRDEMEIQRRHNGALPNGVRYSTDAYETVHSYIRYDGSEVRLDADDQGIHAETRYLHPVTREPMADSFEVTLDKGGSMRADLEELRAGSGTVPDRAGALADWVDRMAGDEGLLWRLTSANDAIRRRYLYGPR